MSLRTALEDLATGERPDPSLLATDHAQRLLNAVLGHPMLGTHQLLRVLNSLLPRLPRHDAQALTTQLQQAIDQRSHEVYNPPEGGGWIASAPQTTQPLTVHPTQLLVNLAPQNCGATTQPLNFLPPCQN